MFLTSSKSLLLVCLYMSVTRFNVFIHSDDRIFLDLDVRSQVKVTCGNVQVSAFSECFLGYLFFHFVGRRQNCDYTYQIVHPKIDFHMKSRLIFRNSVSKSNFDIVKKLNPKQINFLYTCYSILCKIVIIFTQANCLGYSILENLILY